MKSLLRAASLAAFVGFVVFGAVQPTLANEEPSAPSFEPAPIDRMCGTEIPSFDQMEAIQNELSTWLGQNPDAAVGGQIKVAWHVIYDGPTGNIPQSQIDAQIAYLNSTYSGTGYTFALASVDRTNKRQWFKMTPGSGAESQAKNSLAVSPATRLNIYSCKPGQSLLGWATFPWSYAETSKLHGVVIHYGSVPGGYLSPYNLGGTASHEVGHYLGLYHTFQGGCTGNGDYVSDTPAEATPTSGCPIGKDTCAGGGADPINNYMDYSTDACYTNFTSGQDARMDAAVPQYRPSLLNAALTEPLVQYDASSSRPSALASSDLSREFALQASPNPFRSESVLRFSLPREASVDLRLYNAGGQSVRTLESNRIAAGDYARTIDARDLPVGVYFAALRVDGVTVSRTLVLQR